MYKKNASIRKQVSQETAQDKVSGKTNNEYINHTIITTIGNYEPLLQTIKRRKLKLYGHIFRHDGFYKTIMQGVVEGVCKRGRP